MGCINRGYIILFLKISEEIIWENNVFFLKDSCFVNIVIIIVGKFRVYLIESLLYCGKWNLIKVILIIWII